MLQRRNSFPNILLSTDTNVTLLVNLDVLVKVASARFLQHKIIIFLFLDSIRSQSLNPDLTEEKEN